MTDGAQDFIKYNFATTQDLCKQFITVVTGVLVFSIAFSEKIIAYPSAGRGIKIMLGLSWSAMLAAIISCGIGLTFICLAGGQAVYGFGNGYLKTAKISYMWIVFAGLSFIAAMILLICLATLQAFRK